MVYSLDHTARPLYYDLLLTTALPTEFFEVNRIWSLLNHFLSINSCNLYKKLNEEFGI